MKIRHADPAAFAELVSKLARFAIDNREAIRTARPAEVDGLNDRANDCWEPLLAVAEVAGATGRASLATPPRHFTAWRKTRRALAPSCWLRSVMPSITGEPIGCRPLSCWTPWPKTTKHRGQRGTGASL